MKVESNLPDGFEQLELFSELIEEGVINDEDQYLPRKC